MQRLHDAPRLLDGVLAREVARVTAHRGVEEHLVGRRALAADARELHVELDRAQSRPVGVLRLHPHPRTGPRPDPQDELVRLGPRRVLRDEAEPRRRVEDDAHLGHGHGERLAGTDEERHAGPAPVVDLEPQRAERLRLRVRRDAVDVEVAAVLAADVLRRVRLGHRDEDVALAVR